jgi:hypothetical protein
LSSSGEDIHIEDKSDTTKTSGNSGEDSHIKNNLLNSTEK